MKYTGRLIHANVKLLLNVRDQTQNKIREISENEETMALLSKTKSAIL